MLIFSSSVTFLPIPVVNAGCIDFDGSGNCIQFDDPDAPPSVIGVCVDENGCDIPNPVDNSNIGYRLSGNPDDPFDECVKQFGSEYVVYYPSTHRCGTRDQDCDAFKAGTVWDSAVQKCVYEKSDSNTNHDPSGVNSVVIGIIIIGAVGIGVGTVKVIKNAKAKSKKLFESKSRASNTTQPKGRDSKKDDFCNTDQHSSRDDKTWKGF